MLENMLVEFRKDKEIEKYKKQLVDALEYAKGVDIVDQKTMSDASDQLKAFKTISKSLNQKRIDYFKPYDDAKKNIKAEVDSFIDPTKEGITIIEKRLNDYLNAERIKEKLRIKEEQEAIRKKTEAKIEAISKKAETSGVDLSEVVEAEAEEMARKIEHTERYPVDKTKAKGQMSSTKQRFVMDANVYDLYAFLGWVGEKPEARWNFVKVNDPEVRAKAKSIGKVGKWPNGIETFEKPVLTTR